ncbi:MAG: hypothetical protein HZT39_02150 [Pseudoxanthomonas sp.]|nr:MAG: hypothetical protein HZT39_02150 [Pseudoxanthomonas sp.]
MRRPRHRVPHPPLFPQPFEDLDTNGDGAISKDEAAVDPPLAQAFGMLDTDADGRLTPRNTQSTRRASPDPFPFWRTP